ncbi:MAG: hypothetical protein M2R45_04391 [Verrucomicrobia subdivision 3 bacterium]|nr:hypothetical protein [Limisphaerales bacterium]MCS1417270.1 hypothetical protein [Limisphaerales bacterium]
MSLKAFHIVFVVLTTAMSLFVGGWGLNKYFSEGREISDLVLGVGGLFVAVALVIYGRYVIKKLRHISYL